MHIEASVRAGALDASLDSTASDAVGWCSPEIECISDDAVHACFSSDALRWLLSAKVLFSESRVTVTDVGVGGGALQSTSCCDFTHRFDAHAREMHELWYWWW